MNAHDAAKARADRVYRSPGFRRAYVNGATAAIQGRPVDANPYPVDQKKTWRAAYRNAWNLGYRSVAA